MKVLMVTPSYYPSIGGIETFIETIVKKLNERGVNADVMSLNRTADWQPVWRGSTMFEGSHKVIKVPTRKIPEIRIGSKTLTPMKAYLQTSFLPKSSYSKLVKNYDISHFHDENDLSLLFSTCYVRKPRIFHYHTLPLSFHDLRKKEKVLCKFLLRKLVLYHMVNSGYSKDLLVRLGIDSRRVFVFPNVIDLHEYRETSSSFDSVDKNILCICRLNFYKADAINSLIDSALELCKHLPNLNILVAGGGPYYRYVEARAIEINRRLKKKVIVLLGEIADQDKKLELIRSSNLVVGASRVALEAMACRKPVIVVGDRFAIGNSYAAFCGIVKEDNIEELEYYNFSFMRNVEGVTSKRIAEVALPLLTDEKYQRHVGAFGRHFVERKYDAKKAVGTLEKIYESLEARL